MASPSSKKIFIEDRKKRLVTFRKKKDGLKKRGEQLSTLCGIQLMLIIYGPNGTVDTWPTEHQQVKNVIERYQNVRSRKGNVSFNRPDYLNERIRKKKSQLLRITKVCSYLSFLQKSSLDSRIDAVKDRINALTGSHKIDFEHNSSGELITHLQESYHNGENAQSVEHERSPGEVGVEHGFGDILVGCDGGEVESNQTDDLMVDPQGVERRSPLREEEVGVENDLGGDILGCDGGKVESNHNGYPMVDPQYVEHEWRSHVGDYMMADPQGVEHEWSNPIGGEFGDEHEWSLNFDDVFDDPLFDLRGSHEIDLEHNYSSGELITHHQESYQNDYLIADPQGVEHKLRNSFGGKLGPFFDDASNESLIGTTDPFYFGSRGSNEIGFEHNSSEDLITHQESYQNGYLMPNPQVVGQERKCLIGGEVGVEHERSSVFENASDDPLIDATNPGLRASLKHNPSKELTSHLRKYSEGGVWCL